MPVKGTKERKNQKTVPLNAIKLSESGKSSAPICVSTYPYQAIMASSPGIAHPKKRRTKSFPIADSILINQWMNTGKTQSSSLASFQSSLVRF